MNGEGLAPHYAKMQEALNQERGWTAQLEEKNLDMTHKIRKLLGVKKHD